jgi:hypothetical protein
VSCAVLHSIAVRVAMSKIMPLPLSRAFNSAVLYTFSNTRGTDPTTVGGDRCGGSGKGAEPGLGE